MMSEALKKYVEKNDKPGRGGQNIKCLPEIFYFIIPPL